MTHIIYISGLGDRYDFFRKLGLLFWRGKNIEITHIAMRWEDPSESYEVKLDRIKDAIDKYPQHTITLVGESAGGAVAIAAYYANKSHITKVVTICGMNQGAANVNPAYYRKNPAFKEAMSAVDTIHRKLSADDKKKLLTVYSSLDITVRPKHSFIDGARAIDVHTPGHFFSIAAVLFFKKQLVLE
jgi:pimeloyl-ACP methyl ester carboxylesterase